MFHWSNLNHKLLFIKIEWIDIHSNFTLELSQKWADLGWTYHQVKEWVNAFGVNFDPQDYEFITWLVKTKGYSAEQTLNQANLEELKAGFIQWQQNQTQAQIQSAYHQIN